MEKRLFIVVHMCENINCTLQNRRFWFPYDNDTNNNNNNSNIVNCDIHKTHSANS